MSEDRKGSGWRPRPDDALVEPVFAALEAPSHGSRRHSLRLWLVIGALLCLALGLVI